MMRGEIAEMNIVDARGLDCPKPVILTKETVEKGCRSFAVWVDNEVAASNVERFLENKGFMVKKEYGEESIVLEAKIEPKEGGPTPQKKEAMGIMFTSDNIGAGSEGLGEVLMKSCLGTFVQGEKAPSVIALMNNAVKMAVEGSSCHEYLCELRDRGTLILVCGTCTKHFGITEAVSVGVISNMFEITEAVFGTSKPVVIG
ncbi:MAG: sulfurtransferase-like selenium metabolism protein YedF [Synergistaceae bacterium]|nr:sulfurtransferase-like selenium metabolism protein YedF [Synergistaceae bacterium]